MTIPCSIPSTEQSTLDNNGREQQPTHYPTSGINGMPDRLSRDEPVVANNNNEQSPKDDASPSSASSSGNRVLFSTPFKYDRWMTLIISIPLISMVIVMIILQSTTVLSILGPTFIFLVLVFLLVLPRQVDIRSNGTIGVKTFLVTFQFGDICDAYSTASGLGTVSRARCKFTTCFGSQVVIRRRFGKCDVLITPMQAEEFLQTLHSVISRVDIEPGSSPKDSTSETK